MWSSFGKNGNTVLIVAKVQQATVASWPVGGWVTIRPYAALMLQSSLTFGGTHTFEPGNFLFKSELEAWDGVDCETTAWSSQSGIRKPIAKPKKNHIGGVWERPLKNRAKSTHCSMSLK